MTDLDEFSFGSKDGFVTNGTLVVDSRNHPLGAPDELHPHRLILKQTPSGSEHLSYIETGNSQDATSDRALIFRALSKTMSDARQSAEIIIGVPGDIREDFLTHQLPILLRNELLKELNQVPREALLALIPKNPDDETLARVNASIVHCLRTRKLELPPEGVLPLQRSGALRELEAFMQARYGEQILALAVTERSLTQSQGFTDQKTKALRFEREHPGFWTRVLNLPRYALWWEEQRHRSALSKQLKEVAQHAKEVAKLRTEALSSATLEEAKKHLEVKGCDIKKIFGNTPDASIKQDLTVILALLERRAAQSLNNPPPHEERPKVRP